MLHLDNLILEVTRKCNLRCAHCLRGNPQRITMTRPILHNALSNVEFISTVTFTGGEPSLATEVIKDFLDICLWRKLEFNSFYIVTNGKTRNGYKEFLKTVDRLYQFAGDKDMCAMTVSRDQYHRSEFKVDMSKFYVPEVNDYGEDTGRKIDGEYPPYFNPAVRDRDIHEPIMEGRAIETQVGWREPDIQQPWVLSDQDNGDTRVEGEVYVAANGNVVSSCTMSFHRTDKESKGNVLTTPLTQILESYCDKQEEVVSALA